MDDHTTILKELSDIKASLAVNTNETSNIKTTVGEVKVSVKEVDTKLGIQNGRVRTLEDWSKDAQKIIESTSKLANETANNYKNDKIKVWTTITLVIALWGILVIVGTFTFKYFASKTVADILSTYNITSNETNN